MVLGSSDACWNKFRRPIGKTRWITRRLHGLVRFTYNWRSDACWKKFRRRWKMFRQVARDIHGLVRFTSNRCSSACWKKFRRPAAKLQRIAGHCVRALMGCLRSGARCVSVSRANFAFWPAAWGCSSSPHLNQVSAFFIAATQLCQVCLLLCPPVRPMARGPNISYRRH